MRKTTNNNYNALSLLIGAGAAVLVCFGATAGLAHLLLKEKIGEGSADLIITVILLLSATLGSFLTARLQGKQPLISAAITTVVLILIMLLGGLATDGKFQNVILRTAAVAVGGTISCVFCLKKTGKTAVRKKRYR